MVIRRQSSTVNLLPQLVMVVVAVVVVLLLMGLSKHAEAVKIDCHPIGGATKEKCQALGCVWLPIETSSLYHDNNFEPAKSLNNLEGGTEMSAKPRVDEPWCFYPDHYVGYKVVKQSDRVFKLTRIVKSALGNDVKNVEIRLEPHNGGKLLQIKMVDLDMQRFEPELPKLNLLPGTSAGSNLAGTTSQNGNNAPSSWSSRTDFGQFSVEVRKSNKRQQVGAKRDNSYWLIIKRKETDAIVFATDLSKLIFSDQFIQLNSLLSSPFVYGLGEHYDTFLKFANQYKVYSFYNTDTNTQPGGTRSYGGFPFLINLDSENNTKAHGIYLRNSNAMDIVLQNDLSVTFRPIGGILDFFLLIGPTPLDVIGQFQHLVGRPSLPPRWSLGFHLCRYNYQTLDNTKLVWQRTRDAGIPFDVQWNDIDYMDRDNDFTYDPVNYRGLPEFVDELHAVNMHYMILFDPGVSQESHYYPYELGERMGIFIRNATNQILVGKMWNKSGRTVYPDMSHRDAPQYWSELFVKFRQQIRFDGACLDNNDISSFANGSIDGCPELQIEQPPYLPGGYPLQTHSLCLSAKHQAGLEYNVHNLYSFYEAIATRVALRVARPSRRSLIMSRATHPGQGQLTGHWSGDVQSTWGYLKWSIASLLEHNMYGFSLAGTDICGFLGDTTAQLCARWSTLGAFYTFSRNHNNDKSIDQDPVALGPEVVEANKNALTKRYSLLPYLYTLIHKAHKFGEPVTRSMAFEFFDQHDKLDLLQVEDQFMWGPAVLVAPIVEPDTYTKVTYLAPGRWYELDITPESTTFDFDQVKVPKVIDSQSVGHNVWHTTNQIALTNMPIFYRGGQIIPVYANVRRTTPETVDQPIGLEIALCELERAHGELILDDGESIEYKANYLKMHVRNRVLKIELIEDDFQKEVQFGQVKVYGLTVKVSAVKSITSSFDKSLNFKQKDHMLMFDLAGAIVTKSKPLIVEWS